MHRGKAIPLEIYHGVPKGWNAAETIAEHQSLGGTCPIGGPNANEPGAPAWLPERDAWLQYRATLYRVADGLKEDDLACVELAVRYIELRYIGSYSGFIRSLLSRRLKHATLSAAQRQRLHEHFLQLVLDGERTEEFRHYLALWRRILTADQRLETLQKVSATLGAAASEWLDERFQHAAKR
jgi:hypothetical protein